MMVARAVVTSTLARVAILDRESISDDTQAAKHTVIKMDMMERGMEASMRSANISYGRGGNEYSLHQIYQTARFIARQR